MRLVVLVTLLMFCASVFASAQDDCHFGSEDAFDGLVNALTHEKSCSAAVAKLHDCAWGSSADTQLAPIVVEKCEKTFFNKLSPAGKARYEDEMQLCAYEYARQQGTMYMSAAALCQVDIAADFSANTALADRPADHASFNCNKAQTLLEKAICSDVKLGHADIVLARVYESVLKHSEKKDKLALIQTEKQWLQGLPAKCGLSAMPLSQKSLNCVRNEFELRFTALVTALDSCDGITTDCLKSITDEINQASAAASGQGQRASFDCEGPSNALEIVICADAELGQTDIKLAQAYHDADSVIDATQHKDLVNSERQWLRYINGKCPLGAVGGFPPVLTRSCIRTAFEMRIEQLQTCPLKKPQERIPCLNNFRLFQNKQDAQ